MTAPRDADSIIAAWLEDGPGRLPEATKRAIAVTTRTIRQSRHPSLVPWRSQNVNGMTRFALAAAAVLVAAVGGLSLLRSTGPSGSVGGPGSPTPTPASSMVPSGSPSIQPSPGPSAGTIILTDAGCTWSGNPGTVGLPPILTIRFQNQTDDHGLYILHWVKPGHTWQEGVDLVAEIQRQLATGSEWPPNDVSLAVAEHQVAAGRDEVLGWVTSGMGDGPIEEFRQGGSWRWEPGTYGVICSANTSPTGDILTTFLAGPLEITTASPSVGPSRAP